MAIYRTIYMNFWKDTKIVDDFTPEDKYFMLYCLTNDYTNLCGCFEISIKQMSTDIGYNVEIIEKLLDRFEKVHKIILYNKENKELLIKNWYKYNWTKSEKLDKPLLKEIENVKTIEFKAFLIDLYNKRDTVSIPYMYPIYTTVTDTVTDTITDKKKKTPCLEEIKNYIKEKELNVDAEQFYNYFTEGNWIDSKGNKVKNWKQKLLTWNKYGTQVNKKTNYNNYEKRKYDDWDKLYANKK